MCLKSGGAQFSREISDTAATIQPVISGHNIRWSKGQTLRTNFIQPIFCAQLQTET